MSERLSETLLTELRKKADESSRPKQRNATLTRMVEACQAITKGEALAVIRLGLPEAEHSFRVAHVKLIPRRIEEYVRAKFLIDTKAKRKSDWIGPKDLTIRKDPELYSYVKAVAQEHEATVTGAVTKGIEKALDDVPDLSLRAELRLAIARGHQSTQDLMRLKAGMRKMRPTIDVDALVRGISPKEPLPVEFDGTSDGVHQDSTKVSAQSLNAVLKLQDRRTLAKCGLQYDEAFGNVVEAKTRYELLSAEELEALRALVGLSDGKVPY